MLAQHLGGISTSHSVSQPVPHRALPPDTLARSGVSWSTLLLPKSAIFNWSNSGILSRVQHNVGTVGCANMIPKTKIKVFK